MRFCEAVQTLSFRGRRSRNKVSVGEPAEGSLSFLHPHLAYRIVLGGGFQASATAVGLPSAGVALFASRRSRTLLRQSLERPILWSRPSACARALATDSTNHTTLVSGYLGSLNDEERSEMRYLM